MPTFTPEQAWELLRRVPRRSMTPPGRTPFFVGDKAVHEGPPPGPFPEDSPRVPSEPSVEMTLGEPMEVERVPRSAPALQVSTAEKVVGRQPGASLMGPGMPEAMGGGGPSLPPRVQEYLAQRRTPQQTASSMQLGSRLARAGAMAAEALTGSRYDRGAFEGLEGDAARVVEEDRARQAMAARQAEAEAERAIQERGMRLREEEATRGATEAERRAAFKQQRLQQDAAQFAARQQAEAEALRQRLASDAANRAQQREFMQEERKARQGEATAREQAGRDERALAQLAERSSIASQMKEDLATLKGAVEKPGDIPGVGPVASAVPEILISPEGTTVRQAAMRLFSNVLRQRSGQTVTPQEAARGLASYGMGPGASEDAFRKGMARLAGEAQESLRNTEAGYRPEVVEARRSLGGVTSADIPTIRPSGVRKQYSPSRNQTRVLDEAGRVLRIEEGDTRGR